MLLSHEAALDWLGTPGPDTAWGIEHERRPDGRGGNVDDPERWRPVWKGGPGARKGGGKRMPTYREELEVTAPGPGQQPAVSLRAVPIRLDVARLRRESDDAYVERLAAPRAPAYKPVRAWRVRLPEGLQLWDLPARGILLGAWEATAAYRPDPYAPLPPDQGCFCGAVCATLVPALPAGPPAPPSYEERKAWARRLLKLQQPRATARARRTSHHRSLREEIACLIAGHEWGLGLDAVKRAVGRIRALIATPNGRPQ
jgi:hypothetical protein